MAEFVQLNLETMLPELEAMEKIQLFTQDEVRRIINKRKEFEYKMQRGTKFKEDLLNYIRYEWDLLIVIKNKAKKDKNFGEKRDKVAYSVIKHIQKLFSEALTKFGSDVKIWLSYVDFCVQARLIPAMSRALERMLKLHKDKPQLFCTAAQTEFNVTGDMERARVYLMNGIRFHKESELLYREAFAMELAYAKQLRMDFVNRHEPIPDDDPLLNGHLAELFYESSIMNIRSIDLTSEMYTISKKFTFAAYLKERIYNDISEKFKDKELRWDIIARNEVENPHEDLSAKDAIKACVSVYEEGVSALNTESMWTYYIDTMWTLNEDLSFLKNFKINCLTQAFLGAHAAGKLKEDYYLKWATKLEGEADKEKRKDVLKSGTGRFPGSVKLWMKYLESLTTIETSYDTMLNNFDGAVSELKANKICTLPIWKFMINYAQLCEPSKVEDLMKKGAAMIDGGDVAAAVRTMYLEWVVLSKGLKAGRRAYAAYSLMPPFSLQLHQKMIELENYSTKTDVHKIRKCYENMISQFGKESADVWMDYVKFEQKRGEPRKGGLQAVVWTDFIQGMLMVMSVCAVLVVGTIRAGGVGEVLSAAMEGDRIEFFNMDPDPTVRLTFWSSFIGVTFFWSAHFAFSPASMQRYISLPTYRDAQKAVILLCLGVSFFITVSGLIGWVMYAEFRKCDPLSSGLIARPDQILPLFVVKVCGHIKGLSGLFLAGVVCAALSSMSASLNTLAGTFYEDFLEPVFEVKPTEKKASFCMKVLVVLFGFICVCMVSVIEKLGAILEISAAFGGMTAGTTLGLFLLGLLFPWSNNKGAIVGGITSLFSMAWMAIGQWVYKFNSNFVYPSKSMSVEGCAHNFTMVATSPTTTAEIPIIYRLSIFYYTMLGAIIVVVVGMFVSFLTGFTRPVDVNPDLLSPIAHVFLPRRPKKEDRAAEVPLKKRVRVVETRNGVV